MPKQLSRDIGHMPIEELLALEMALCQDLDTVRRRLSIIEQQLIERQALESAHRLTVRQSQVLSWLVMDLSNKEIGLKLNITERTVKFHVSRLLVICGVQKRAQLKAQFRRTPDETPHFGHLAAAGDTAGL